jgi:hypothetical protein
MTAAQIQFGGDVVAVIVDRRALIPSSAAISRLVLWSAISRSTLRSAAVSEPEPFNRSRVSVSAIEKITRHRRAGEALPAPNRVQAIDDVGSCALPSRRIPRTPRLIARANIASSS